MPIVLKIHKQATIKHLKNEASAASAKHVDVKLKFLKDFAEKEWLNQRDVASEDMVADLLTKALHAPRIVELQTKIGWNEWLILSEHGDILMSMKTPRGVKKGVPIGVWHIPKLSRDLFSVGHLTKDPP
ncbi:unnamed protein product [Peronospora belbahrii]|uniref:Uncharacterized protein n=1 Tax=Peronospora belbahrii TaxID=622444 RepID=A0AAU9L169_9STRA|nr:unnamed protein product [Peronospora belbahrii]